MADETIDGDDERIPFPLAIAIAEHGSSSLVGIASLDLGSPVLRLAQFTDTASHSESLSVLVSLGLISPPTSSAVTRILISKTNSASTLVGRIRSSFPACEIVELPRSDFSEASGAVLLHDAVSRESVASSRDFESSSNFLCVAAAAALMKNVVSSSARVFAPGSLLVEVTAGEGRVMVTPATASQLELVANAKSGTRKGSLLDSIDHTKTPAGSRMLVSNLVAPICDEATLQLRLDTVDELVREEAMFFGVTEFLKAFQGRDLERIAARMLCTSPRKPTKKSAQQRLKSIVVLQQTLSKLPQLSAILGQAKSALLKSILGGTANNPVLGEISREISRVINDDAAVSQVQLSFAVRPDVDPLLDVARKEYTESADDMSRIVAALGDSFHLRRTEKRGFFLESMQEPPAGRFIEIACVESKGRGKRAPSDAPKWTCTTVELASVSKKNCDALGSIFTFSCSIIEKLAAGIGARVADVVRAGSCIACLDMLSSFATYAMMCPGETCRPEFTRFGPIAIKLGRHPILDVAEHEALVPNDTFLSSGVQVISGGNASGKSTYLSQVALITVLAHIGCFVPASFASFRLVDRILSRIGSSDAEDAGALMSELRETRQVIASAGDHSLVLVDELGRATSPIGGASLAWACAEHLALNTRACTLFVTHFSQVASGLESLYPSSVSTRFFVIERAARGGIRPMYTMRAGVSGDRIGIETAQAAGLPASLVESALAIRRKLATKHQGTAVVAPAGMIGDEQRSRRELAMRLMNLAHSSLDEQSIRLFLISLKREESQVD